MRKTVVRMPGPSWIEKRWILKTTPLVTRCLPAPWRALHPRRARLPTAPQVPASRGASFTCGAALGQAHL